MEYMRKVIVAAVIKNKKILLAKKKETWMLPGGKPEQGESDLECLCREISEEMSGSQLKPISFYGNFQGTSPHKGDIVDVYVHFATITGNLKPSREISDVRFVEDFNNYALSESSLKIISSLRNDGYL